MSTVKKHEILQAKTLVFAACIFLALWLIKIFRRAYWTPLRAIPGPWYAKFTQLWMKKHTLAGRRMHYVHELHAKYGPIVRVSPEEIDIADAAAFKEIHRIGGGFRKSPWYQTFRKGETTDVFSVTDSKEHAQKRRLLAPLFSNSALMNNWYPVVVDNVTMAVEKIKREASGAGEADIFKWWTFMTADVISHLAFGESFGMLNLEKKTEHMQTIEDATKFGLISSELPLLYSLLTWIPFKSVQDSINGDEKVQTLAEETMRRAQRTGIGATNIFSKLSAENEKDREAYTDYQLAFEAGGFIVAGSGTTAVSLTYLVWAVLSNPSVQAKLEAEVGALQPAYTDADLENLPYLSAVIEEALRVYSAAPGALPRTVPNGGATLSGYFIPEGITVSTQAYTLHRDSATYPEPEKFVPERFISPSGEFHPSQGAFAPFGAGSRTCLGIHLARIELRHGAALFFRECKGARLSTRTTPASMEMVNYFLVSPASEQCWITLNPEASQVKVA
ncbi:cytochrome P450 [Dactylonectria estremocensis]|uniref:Cytochrome P450 n=1 Tax=Dactylonectria estremocensis TaxID=1079267 RepID=A0A9P9DMZ4_9HYPO|nr:cytochrome P450 [Dactylonectria estremocensis]